MSVDGSRINHVTDTAFLAAHYRALESERPDALFSDPLAKMLVGDRGRAIAARMGRSAAYIQWSVSIRTVVIDRLLEGLIPRGVDTVVNLGAGLDTRPYRLSLPPALRWMEVDYPATIEWKNRALEHRRPRVALERVGLDLADRHARRSWIARLCAPSTSSLVLTEGVVPYLTADEAGSLAADIHQQPQIDHWVAEFYSPALYPHLQSRERQQVMRNAPFQFFPDDWFGFFASHGWIQRDIKYLPEEAFKLRRTMPSPWWARVLQSLRSQRRETPILRSTGYVVYGRTPAA